MAYLGKDERKEKSLYEKVNNIDRRYIWWFLIIAICVILISPLNIPLSVTDRSVVCYDFLKTLKPGDVVLFSNGNTVTVNLAVGEVVQDVIRYLLEHDVNIVILSLQQEGVSTTYSNLAKIPGIEKYKYGVDYVHFGFYSGGQTVVASMVQDVWGTLGADVNKTPVGKIPLMANIKKAIDFDAWFDTGGGGEFLYFVKNWSEPLGIPGSTGCTSANIPDATTWWKNGLLKGFLGDQRGAVEFARLTGYTSLLGSQLDAQSMGHLYLIALIIIGNVFYLNEKMKGGKK